MIFIVVLAISIRATSRSTFCASCHEMRYEYAAWRQSSHSDVACEECHQQAGFTGMIRTKIGAMREVALHVQGYDVSHKPGKADVPDETCRKCHQNMRSELHYHLLRVTHKAHIDRGMRCTQCHANVVHGGRAPYKNTPRMATCFKCHDGQQAPNNCSLCHVKMGEIRPQLYNPSWIDWHRKNIADTGLENCQRCHGQKFCQTCHQSIKPHGADWLDQHRKTKPEQLEGCKQCHPARGNQPMADFCLDCHAQKRAHDPGYISTHMNDFRRSPDTCARCHKQEFCLDCHKHNMPHPPDFLQTHVATTREDQRNCRVCHPNNFCQACHLRQAPASHSRTDFRANHSGDLAKDPVSCRSCHEAPFCQSCHRDRRPSSHNTLMWGRTHGAAARDQRSCVTCHGAGFCSDCHQVKIPHPLSWAQAHQTAPISRRSSVCETCHTQQFCASCHQGGMIPVSHKATSWARMHGTSRDYQAGNCSKCHTDRFCSSCHRLPMPHTGTFKSHHGDMATGEQGRYCSLCHAQSFCTQCHTRSKPPSHTVNWPNTHGRASLQTSAHCSLCHSQQFCASCHKLPMPHPNGWTAQHGDVATKTPQVCAQCHKPADCLACHRSSPPAPHREKDFKAKHGGKNNKELCRLCHGPPAGQTGDACGYCHGNVAMPHPDDWATEGHKKVASFKQNSVCFRCHTLDDCKQCHEIK